MEQTIGDFLLRRLKEAGLQHIFGVAGDFNLALLEQLERTDPINWVGCCNELNAAYSADGYARSRGLGAVITTYGVAGAYAEHAPVVFMVGAPPLSAIRRGALLHHTAGDGDYNNMMTCGRQFSVAQARVTPQNAVVEIDRCLRSCIVERRPVYLQIPSDIPYLCIRTPAGPVDLAIQSDSLMLDQCGPEVLQKLQSATNPAILVDADVARFGLSEKVRLLAGKLNCPIASMGTAKGVIDEQDPHFVGAYIGASSAPSVRQVVEDADCLLRLGVRLIDSTTGSFSAHLDPSVCVDIEAWSATVNSLEFAGIT
jgi:indolepyruvate decarboxylase